MHWPDITLGLALARIEYELEVMKGGQILERRAVSAKASYSFGRSPACDFPMEHPTLSRLHAVLQFRADGAAFVYDAGSVHGTFLNKRRIKPRVHAPLRRAQLTYRCSLPDCDAALSHVSRKDAGAGWYSCDEEAVPNDCPPLVSLK